MDKKLEEIIKSLERNEKKYFVSNSGEIREQINPAYTEKTGYYINDKGQYVTETGALSFDQKTGVYEDDKGDLREDGFWGSNKTGYYKDDKDKFQKESLIGRSYKQNQQSSNQSSVPEDGTSLFFFYVKWAIIIGIAIFVIMVAIFLSPLILLIWYLLKKREVQWIGILGLIFSAYLTYDILSSGFITGNLMKMNLGGNGTYLALGYFTFFCIILGLIIDKYSLTKIPISQNGNFFQQKDIKERRPFIAGFSALLLIIFSIFQFVNLSGNNNENSPSITDVSNTTNSSILNNTQNQTSNPIPENISEQNNNFNNSNGKLAIIIDPDGFTNVRNGKGTDNAIIYALRTNENFKVFPTTEKWWGVKLSNGSSGYILNDRVKIINSGLINGTNVIMRDGHSTQSKILSSFKNSGEIVEIL